MPKVVQPKPKATNSLSSFFQSTSRTKAQPKPKATPKVTKDVIVISDDEGTPAVVVSQSAPDEGTPDEGTPAEGTPAVVVSKAAKQLYLDYKAGEAVEPVYTCEECEASWNGKTSKYEHTAAHKRYENRNEVSLKCAYCDKSFGTNRQLQRHQSGTHSNLATKKYVCTGCSRPFGTGYALSRHHKTRIGKSCLQAKEPKMREEIIGREKRLARRARIANEQFEKKYEAELRAPTQADYEDILTKFPNFF